MNVKEPFRLGLHRVRGNVDPVQAWRIRWTDAAGDVTAEEVLPGDWMSRSRTFSTPGTYGYRVFLTDAGGEIEVQGGSVTVVHDDPFPRVGVQAIDATASERSGTPLRFRFTRSGQANLPLFIAVDFLGGNGRAVNGTDFGTADGQAAPLSVAFAAGQSVVEVKLYPIADADETEGPETVTATIFPSSLYAVTDATATATITDAPSVERGDLAGTVFDDANGNGERDAGESGLAGQKILLDANRNGVTDTGESVSTTDLAGRYTHALLPAGTYTLALLPQDGRVATAATTRDGVATPRRTTDGIDFSAATPVTVRGRVFDDSDGNGVYEAGEPGRANVAVYADLDGNGAFDAGEPATVSGPDGQYVLANTPPGPVTIRAADTPQFISTTGGGMTVNAVGGAVVDDTDHGQRRVAPQIDALAITPSDVRPSRRMAAEAGLSEAPNLSVVSGALVMLAAGHADAWTRTVRFFRESNGTPGWQAGDGGDVEIGRDTVADDGWSLDIRAGLEAGSHTFYAVAEDGDGTAGVARSATLDVTGSPGPTRVGVRALQQLVREGSTLSATFEILRVGDNSISLVVNLANPSGPGLTVGGIDHPNTPTSVVIPAGQDAIRVSVPVPDDGQAEGEERVRLSIVAGTGYSLSTHSFADVVVRDASTTPAVVSVLEAVFRRSDGPDVVEVSFSEDVAASLATAAEFIDLSTNETVRADELAVRFDPATGTASFAVPTANDGRFADGQYRLRLLGDAVKDTTGRRLDGNGDGAAGGDFVFDFTVGQDAAAPVLMTAESVKRHNGITAALNFPLTGRPGVEGRNGGITELVLTFDEPIALNDAFVATLSNGTAAAAVEGNKLILSISGVADAQPVSLQIAGITDAAGNTVTYTFDANVLAADINGDANVTFDDFVLMQTSFGTSFGQPAFESMADFDLDGIVDFDDFVILQTAFGNVI